MRERRTNLNGVSVFGAAALALLGISVVTAQRLDRPPSQNRPAQSAAGALNAIPANLGPNESFRGVPWSGGQGVTVTVDELMTMAASEPVFTGPPLERRRDQSERKSKLLPKHNPRAPAIHQWPPDPDTSIPQFGPRFAFNIGSSFLGAKLFTDSGEFADSNFIPPDSTGAVGPTQILVAVNGRLKLYDKNGVLLGFDVNDQTFWSSVITSSLGGTFVSDPHVRYDRLSGRWFITEIDVPEPCECSNRILLAVSSGSTITNSSSFTLYSFQNDAVGPTPNPDTGKFADYDTLGVDQNALYIGANIFNGANDPMFPSQFSNTTGYVVNKASLLSGTLVVTAFRGMLDPNTFVGPYSPQGVANDTPGATEGYFIGHDGSEYGRLAIRRIITPGATPSISGTIILNVPLTSSPINQVAQGSTLPLDPVDFRLFEAKITQNRLTGVSSLWTAHNIGVLSNGAPCNNLNGSPCGDRNGARWYQIDNLTTMPTLTQSGTVWDSAASNPVGYWMNSVGANGQGHASMGQSLAGASLPASVAVVSRLSSDPAGQMNNLQTFAGVPGYNLQRTPGPPDCMCSSQRWGDYSQVVVDPADDMTMWTFQEYTNSTGAGNGSWGVRVVKLLAPPPATPISASPPTVPRSSGTINVTVTGASSGGSGFFDPGAGFPNHIQAFVSGGVVVNSVTFMSPTTVTLNISTGSASPGLKSITITNPDGQSMTGTNLLAMTGGQVAGDFDGDAKADPTVYRASTGGWHSLNSSTSYGSSTSVSWGLSTDKPVPGDYDGDGKQDPAIFRPSTGLWAILKSSTGFSTAIYVSWGLSTDVPVPADFDGDGKTDPTVYRPSTGGWHWLNSSANYGSSTSVSWGLSTDLPVPGDYDGDGKADPTIFRPSTGLWAALKSSTGYGSSIIVAWGLSTDVAVPGDYDGDGRIDPAVFRPSTGAWHVLRSSTSYGSSFSVSWGLSTDVPVPGDFDADGKTDPAIFRPSTGLWAALKSSTGYGSSIIVSWGLSTDTPILKRP